MANSVAAKADKWERLVESATVLFHEQGVHRTTLAEVAERAHVPVGNVYYDHIDPSASTRASAHGGRSLRPCGKRSS